jgi:hypothetical protein
MNMGGVTNLFRCRTVNFALAIWRCSVDFPCVKLWAVKLKNPTDDTNIGVVILSASDGSIIKADLHPNSVE